MTALELAAALLTPDSDLLPAESFAPRRWSGMTGPTWQELDPRHLRMVTRTGLLFDLPWHWSEVRHRFGPLREVTP